MSDTVWRMALQVPQGLAFAFGEVIEEFCAAVTVDGLEEEATWRIEGFAEAEPDPAAIAAALIVASAALGLAPPTVSVERLEARDWLTENLRTFQPIEAGRFHIQGSHVETPPPPGTLAMVIDAGAAFGTGEHASTRGCLLALDRLAGRRRFRRILDMGCGTAILGIAAARLWRVPVLAVDIDPRSVEVARRTARLNGAGHLIRAAVSDGYRSPAVRDGAPYDLVLANILARPLARMAGDLARHLAPGGIAILAGFLRRDSGWLRAAHRAHGLRLVARLGVDEWETLVLQRTPI